MGGNFLRLTGGTSLYNNLAALNGTAWVPLRVGTTNGVDNVVYALGEMAGKVIIGGGFTMLRDGTMTRRVAIWDGTNSSNSLTVPRGATPPARGVDWGAGPGDSVKALAVYQSKL